MNRNCVGLLVFLALVPGVAMGVDLGVEDFYLQGRHGASLTIIVTIKNHDTVIFGGGTVTSGGSGSGGSKPSLLLTPCDLCPAFEDSCDTNGCNVCCEGDIVLPTIPAGESVITSFGLPTDPSCTAESLLVTFGICVAGDTNEDNNQLALVRPVGHGFATPTLNRVALVLLAMLMLAAVWWSRRLVRRRA